MFIRNMKHARYKSYDLIKKTAKKLSKYFFQDVFVNYFKPHYVDQF